MNKKNDPREIFFFKLPELIEKSDPLELKGLFGVYLTDTNGNPLRQIDVGLFVRTFQGNADKIQLVLKHTDFSKITKNEFGQLNHMMQQAMAEQNMPLVETFLDSKIFTARDIQKQIQSSLYSGNDLGNIFEKTFELTGVFLPTDLYFSYVGSAIKGEKLKEFSFYLDKMDPIDFYNRLLGELRSRPTESDALSLSKILSSIARPSDHKIILDIVSDQRFKKLSQKTPFLKSLLEKKSLMGGVAMERPRPRKLPKKI